MKLVCVVMRDEKLGSFMMPGFYQSEGMAIRSFMDEVNRAAEDNGLYRHPEDYTLFALGVFESESAEWILERVPRLLMTGAQAKKE